MTSKEIEELDLLLKNSGVPIKLRPLECFKRLFGDVENQKDRSELFDPLIEWYLARYGESARWDGVLGHFPLLIRGDLYLAAARYVIGVKHVDWKSEVEGLSKEIADSISFDEFRAIAEKLSTANTSWQNLHNLHIDDGHLGSQEREWVRRAFLDIENSAITLKHTGDTQTAIFQAHQATEKFLKAALKRSGSTSNPEKFGHNLPKSFAKLVQLDPMYSWLSAPIINLDRLGSDRELRYENLSRSLEDAVAVFHGSLNVCGTLAKVWLFDKARRGAKAKFRECKFYVSGEQNTFYCKALKEDTAVLTLFRLDEMAGSQLLNIEMKKDQSPMYLEVTDPIEEEKLRQQLLRQLRNPGRQVLPEEIGLKTTDGPEGTYTTAVLRRRIR